jgi:hypothetical protein
MDFVTEKNQLIKDILTLGGDGDLETLSGEVASFGESLGESLGKMSLPRLRRVHGKIVTGEIPIEIVESEM